MTATDECPKCKASMIGDPIPEGMRQHYGDGTHFYRVIAVYNMAADRTVAWRCPDCGHEWGRDNDAQPA